MSEYLLQFDAGTLLLEGAPEKVWVPVAFQWDARVKRWRAPALAYREILTELIRGQIPHKDEARQYLEFQFHPAENAIKAAPRPYQSAAIQAWQKHGKRGVIVLPTGAGKTFVAQMAIEAVQRQTLVVVPTLDLMNQWYDTLRATFKAEIGLIGGGYYEIGAITVTTYASAFRFMERLGDKFGLLICDEAHHLPGAGFRYIAELSLAPFRLGLTATPERSDGGEALLQNLLGPTVYRKEAQDLAGEYLADYTIVKLTVELPLNDQVLYQEERAIFRRFIASLRGPSGVAGWQQFVAASARSEAGRRAMQAYRSSKRLALGATTKLDLLASLLQRHPRERVLIFTAENEMVYRISERFLVPAITHETPIKERSEWLRAFNAGTILALATSKVLNEGVNIPEAAIAVVLSGSGSTREHIQRLGRILRHQEGKEAILYEIVSAGTTEERLSERRTDANQFQKPISNDQEEFEFD